MANRNSNHGDVIAGVVLGGMIVGLSSLLLSSKKGTEVKEDISQKIEEYRDTVENYLGALNENIDGIEEKAVEWTDKVKGTIEHVKEEIDDFTEKDHRELYAGLIIGAVLGGAVGVGASKLFPSNADERLVNDMLAKVSTGAGSLQRVIRDISDTLEDRNTNARREERACRSSAPSNEPVDDVIDFALSGLQLWRKFSKKNR